MVNQRKNNFLFSRVKKNQLYICHSKRWLCSGHSNRFALYYNYYYEPDVCDITTSIICLSNDGFLWNKNLSTIAMPFLIWTYSVQLCIYIPHTVYIHSLSENVCCVLCGWCWMAVSVTYTVKTYPKHYSGNDVACTHTNVSVIGLQGWFFICIGHFEPVSLPLYTRERWIYINVHLENRGSRLSKLFTLYRYQYLSGLWWKVSRCCVVIQFISNFDKEFFV